MQLRRALRWLMRRKIELGVFAIGVLLRLSMTWNYSYNWNFDSDEHWDLIQWIAHWGMVPTTETTFMSFHPPLFYGLAAWLVRLGVPRPSLIAISLVSGIVRLATLWAGLELYVVGSRVARVMALALAAVVAASVHVDGMISDEALSCALTAIALLLTPLAFRRTGRFRWPLTLLIGFALGLAIMTKFSTIAILAALGVGVALEFLLSRRSLRERMQALVPWVGTIAVIVGICGWYCARNVRQYGRPFVSSFQLPSQHWLMADIEKKSLWNRRPLDFVLGWNFAIYRSPYRPAGLGGEPRFFPVLIASSVVDYWRYGYSGFEGRNPDGSGRGMREIGDVRGISRLAVIGGTAIFFAALIAWFASMRRLLRQRDMGRVTLLLGPFFVLLAALQFATAFPIDDYGVIKGAYVVFGAPAFYALFGVAAGWAHRQPIRWPLLGVLVFALWFVAAYSFDCRLGIPIFPVS
jgi:4-amino-4-deoxy-L-arabinose transferase-like glycosyltransferase